MADRIATPDRVKDEREELPDLRPVIRMTGTDSFAIERVLPSEVTCEPQASSDEDDAAK
ncbi:MAG: hypothetical protein KDD65_02625 [Bacteroidetes bacterium]|nr:hypothetical protein [Bacteroidota bacterium]